MKMDEANIFVSIAPSHNKNYEMILRSENLDGTNILINVGNYTCTDNLWDLVIEDATPMANPTSSGFLSTLRFQVGKILAYKRLLAKADKSIPMTNYKLYYCNLEDVLNNYFFFRFRKNFQKERILVEDGILNYYVYKITKSRRLTFRTKQMLSSFLGIPYKIVTGLLSGIDRDDVHKQYVKYPEKALHSDKAIKLGNEDISYVPDSKRVLFIGQDVLPNVIGQEAYIKSLDLIVNKISENCAPDSVIFYKPHRNGNYKIAETKLRNVFSGRCETIMDKSPIERLVSDIRPMQIYSFFSTALMNIKLATHAIENLKIYSLPMNYADDAVIKLFEEVGNNHS